MMPQSLSDAEKMMLLAAAREALTVAMAGQPLPEPDLDSLPERLKAPGASFVTLTEDGELRGCIGALQAYQPLFQDVREHAVAAALDDYRFPQVRMAELPQIEIEISVLSDPQPIEYSGPDDLLARLRPGVDGVTLRDGRNRATFLPQVWEKVQDKADFLDHLCAKMGARPNLWRVKHLAVEVYQVEEFHEGQLPGSTD